MNINGALFIFLTNMTFQNVFAVINVKFIYIFALTRMKRRIRHVVWYRSRVSFLLLTVGFLRGIADIFARTSKRYVSHRCVFFMQDTRRGAHLHRGPAPFHCHRVSHDWFVSGDRSLFHYRWHRCACRKCFHVFRYVAFLDTALCKRDVSAHPAVVCYFLKVNTLPATFSRLFNILRQQQFVYGVVHRATGDNTIPAVWWIFSKYSVRMDFLSIHQLYPVN